jgi:transcription initiation factor TFIID TATA-box-binding protein
MKVVIENIVAKGNTTSKPDLEKINNDLEGSRYQKEVMNGIIYGLDDPECDIFLLEDGVIKIHGLTSEESISRAVDRFQEIIDERSIPIRIEDEIVIQEVIASMETERLNPKEVYETFKEENIGYNPKELPGFVLRIGRTGISVLIFPEGKIVCKGAATVSDSVSTLEMIATRLDLQSEEK